MARKQSFLLISYKYMMYTAVVASLCVGLVVLQHLCMSHKEGEFVTSYCLTDSHMRAVIAAVLTVLGVVLISMVSSTVESYRSAKLASGINEGVYIAMASHSVRYRLRALLTPWASAVMLITLCTNAPNLIQTLANLGIKTAGVYVRNDSTADIFDATSYYNASVPMDQTQFANLQTAIGVMIKMRDYRTSATSTAIDHGGGVQVVTSVVRDAYVGKVNIVQGDTTNALKRLETVVTVTSTCSTLIFNATTLSNAVPASRSAVNVTLVAPELNAAEAVIYDVKYAMLSENTLLVQSSLSLPSCISSICDSLGPDTIVHGSTTSCSSVVVVQDQDIAYTVGAKLVTPVKLVSNITTVSASDLADLMVQYAYSIETTPEGTTSSDYIVGVIGIYQDFPAGSFDVPYSNVLHTKLCAASSLALSFLWTRYQESAGVKGMLSTTPVPLYNIVQLTYVSTTNISVIAGVITVITCLVCLVGLSFAVRSEINIKPATDSAFLYNADPALIGKKQALMSDLSDNPDRQLAFEFNVDSVLYSREHVVKYPDATDPADVDEHTYRRINISYSKAGAVPTKFECYY